MTLHLGLNYWDQFDPKQERKLTSARRRLYTLAVIIIKFNTKFLKIQKNNISNSIR